MQKFRKTEGQVLEFYDTKVSLYSDGEARIRKYSKVMQRHSDGWELDKPEKSVKKESASKPAVSVTDHTPFSERISRSDSVSRTRQIIQDYARANADILTSFITLTFAENKTDITEANKCFKSWVTQVKRIYPEFAYIGVPEKQKRGAIHYHLLSNLSCGSDIVPKRETKSLFNKQTKKWTYLEYYDLKYWKHGFSSAFDIKNETDSNFRLEMYICKYITKGLLDTDFFGRKKVLKSNNLKKPQVIYLKTDNPEELANYYAHDLSDIKKETVLTGIQYCPKIDIYDVSSRHK